MADDYTYAKQFLADYNKDNLQDTPAPEVKEPPKGALDYAKSFLDNVTSKGGTAISEGLSSVPGGNAFTQGLSTLGGFETELPSLVKAFASGDTGAAQTALDRLKQTKSDIASKYPLTNKLPMKLETSEDVQQLLKAVPEQVLTMIPGLIPALSTGNIPAAAAILYPQAVLGNLETFGANNLPTAAGAAVPETALGMLPVGSLLRTPEKIGESLLKNASAKGFESGVAGVVGNTGSAGVDMLAQNAVLGKDLFSDENAVTLANAALTGAAFAPVGAVEGAMQGKVKSKGGKETPPETPKPETQVIPQEPPKEPSPVVELPSIKEEPQQSPLPLKDQHKEQVTVKEPEVQTVSAINPDPSDLLAKNSISSDPETHQAALNDDLDTTLSKTFAPLKITPKFINADPNSVVGSTVNKLKSIDLAGKDLPPEQTSIETLKLLHGALSKDNVDPEISFAANRLAVASLLSNNAPLKFDFGDALSDTRRSEMLQFLHKSDLNPVEVRRGQTNKGVFADAFARYNANKSDSTFGKANSENLSPVIQKKFEDLNQTIDKYASQHRTSGISSLGDVLHDPSIQLADPEASKKAIQQSLVDAVNAQEFKNQAIINRALARRQLVGEAPYKDKPFSANALLSDPQSLADSNPAWGYITNVIRDRHGDARQIHNIAAEKLKPLLDKYSGRSIDEIAKDPLNLNKAGQKRFNDFVDIIDSNRMNRFKGYLDKDGNFVYKDGDGNEQKILDKGKSKDLLSLQSMFEDFRNVERATRYLEPDLQKLFLKKGIPVHPTRGDIETLLKTDKGLTPDQKTQLKTLQDNFDYYDALEHTDFVPHNFKGNYAIKGTNPEIGKEALLTFNSKNGKDPIKDEAFKEFKTWKDKLDKEKGWTFTSPYQLTSDRLYNQIRQNGTASELANAAVHRLLKGEKGDKASEEILKDALAKLAARAGGKHFIGAKNHLGYSRDWYHEIPSFVSNMSHYYANKINSPRLHFARNEIEKLPPTFALRKEANRYLDQNTGVGRGASEKFAQTVREGNTVMALAGRTSTALLQLANIVQSVPAQLSKVGGILKTGPAMTRGFATAANFFDFSKGEAMRFDNPKTYERLQKKGKLSDDEIRAVKAGVDAGVIANNLSIDTRNTGSAFNAGHIVGPKVEKIINALSRATEGYSRIGTYLSTLYALRNPKTLNNFHNYLLKYSDAYKQHLESTGSTAPDKAFMASWITGKANATYGVEGRPGFSRNIPFGVGDLIAPMATYQYQMMNNFFRQAVQGPEGRKAMLVMSALLVGSGGLKAIPGAQTLIFTLEEIYKGIFGEDKDLTTDMYKILGDDYKDDADKWTVAGVLNHGALDKFLGIEVGKRIGLGTIPGESLYEAGVRGMVGDDQNAPPPMQSLASPASIPITAASGITQDIANGNGLFRSLVKNLAPGAISDVAAGAAIDPERGVKYKGQYILTPEEASDPTRKLIRSLGFRSYQEEVAKEQQDAIQRADKPFVIQQRRFKNQMINLQVELNKAQADGNWDKASEVQQRVDKLTDKISDYANSKGIGGGWASNTIKDAALEGAASSDRSIAKGLQIKKMTRSGRARASELGTDLMDQ